MKVIFFLNGNTACVNDKGIQEPVLQKPYFELYCEFLEKQGIDPSLIEFTMPDGSKARAFRVESGWNWEIS